MLLKGNFEIDISLTNHLGDEISEEEHINYVKTLINKSYIKAYDEFFISVNKKDKLFKSYNKVISEECDNLKLIMDSLKISYEKD